jgi:predicted dehydrogenase
MSSSERKETYRAGIVGCGRIADAIEDEMAASASWTLLPYSHAGAYERHPRVSLAAAADLNAERLAAFGARRGLRALYTDFEEMLRREDLDLVSVCVPTRLHTAVALAVAAHPVRGIFLEKPIAGSLRDADAVIAALRARGIRAAVNHTRTYDPTYGAIRERIARGDLGAITTVVAHGREGALFGGTHTYDLLRFLLGDEADWVFGDLVAGKSFDPGVKGEVGFAGGAHALVSFEERAVAPFEIDVIGTEGRIRAGNAQYPEFWQMDRAGGRGLVRRGFPGAHDGRSGMLRAVDGLIAAIEGGPKPLSDPDDGRRDLEIAVAFHLSSAARAPIRLPVGDLDYVIDDPWGRAG